MELTRRYGEGFFGASVPRRCRRSVSSAMGTTIGMAMFGAIIFIPLYLQLVYGASATSSGLRMLPLMVGLLTASIASGRAISRIGRYKAFLKEVPLRTTLHRSADLSVEEAAAGGTPPDEVVRPYAEASTSS